MMSLASFLVGMVGPLAARWLAAMGLSLISVTGLSVAYATLKAQVIAGVGGLPAVGLQLGGLFGLWECIGIILGAYVFVLTWRGTSGVWKLAKV